MRVRTLSNTGRSTRMRDAAEQVWPAFWMPALTRKGSAASRSASAKTTCGLFPPSSSVTGTAFAAAAVCTRAPVATEPVQDVERARRQAGVAGDAGESEHRQAGLLGGLQDAGIAHRQRRADAAAD